MDVPANPVGIVLKPEDVPGAVLPVGKAIADCSNLELRRWLECRGIKRVGNKPELMERVKNCISAGRDGIIFLGVDDGKWYDAKRNLVQHAAGSVPMDLSGNLMQNTAGSVSMDVSGTSISALKWEKFPSQTIPKYFNKGHIYTYIAGLEFENEEYEIRDSGAGMTEKPFRRGNQFVSSDHIHDVYDAADVKYYHLKAKCLASFRAKVAYNVKCCLNKVSGAVVTGECECKQSALGKCSHVSAVLLFLSKFSEKDSNDGLSCTSKLQEWGLGAKFKTPGPVASKHYPTVRFNPIARALHDPRPIAYKRNVNLNNFICDIQSGSSGGISMFETLIKLKYDDFQVDEQQLQVIKRQIEIFTENMADYANSYEHKVFAIKGAKVQGSEEWKKWRTYFFTASNTKIASALTTVSAKSRFLKKNLWQMTPSIAMLPALVYGRKNEPLAREQYNLNYVGVTEKLIEVGLCANKEYPHLACSADGLVVGDGIIKRVIEIKCPKVLENADPCNFTSVLSEKQKGSFCLVEENGEIKLKPNHPYLYQVTTAMLVFDVTECDFIVWSKVNMLVVKVKLANVNAQVIQNLTVKLKEMYYNMYIPELFLMKIPRNLPLYEINAASVVPI